MHQKPAIFTPDNEPYLGRPAVRAFDELIVTSLDVNSRIAPWTHGRPLSALQTAACQLIPQSINIALSIRELVRQGYLFGALVLTRPLLERVMIVLYLEAVPSAIPIWDRGWQHREAPPLTKMIEAIVGHDFRGRGHEITGPLNALLHGRPESAQWTHVALPEGKLGHAVSKLLDAPHTCDKVCVETSGILALVLGLMVSIFPDPLSNG